MKVSKNFRLQEFVHPDVWEMSGKSSIWFVDHRLISIAQTLRDRLNKPVIINNWADGGNYSESGFRDPLSRTGAIFSQHKFGRAIDIKVPGIDPIEIRQEIIRNYYKIYKPLGVTAMETDTPTWVHIDCRFTQFKDLMFFAP